MPRAKQFEPMTLADAIVKFMGSPKFRALRPNSQNVYRRALDYWRMSEWGPIPVTDLRRKMAKEFLSLFVDRPATQYNVKTAMMAFQAWAMDEELIELPFIVGIKLAKADGAFEPWSEEQVKLAVTKASPPIAKAIMLAVCTGQRGSDLVRMQWQHVSRGPEGVLWIDIRKTQKTNLPLYVPVIPELEAAMATWERSLGYILAKPNGEPYTRPELGDAWYRERNRNPALEPLKAAELSLHGLRATAIGRLMLAGVSARQIRDVVGLSEAMVTRYTRRIDQRAVAIAAMKQMGYVPNNVVPLKLSVDKSEQTGNL